MQPSADAPRDATPILLAYSGGLDTSFLVPWLAEHHRRPIITVTVDTGGIDAAGARALRERSARVRAAWASMPPVSTVTVMTGRRCVSAIQGTRKEVSRPPE